MAESYYILEQITTGADANDTSTETDSLDSQGYSDFAVSIISKTGTHTTHQFTIQGSPNDTDWFALTDAIVGQGAKHNLICNHKFIRVKCTTAEGGVSTVDIYIQGK